MPEGCGDLDVVGTELADRRRGDDRWSLLTMVHCVATLDAEVDGAGVR